MKRKPALLPVIEPVEGEFGVYWVQSRSRTSMRHRVDLTWYGGNGKCGCEDFGIHYAGLLERGAKPDRRLACWHVRVAREFSALEWWTRYCEMKQEERKRDRETKRTETESPVDESFSRPNGTGTAGPGGRIFQACQEVQADPSGVSTMQPTTDSGCPSYPRPQRDAVARLASLESGMPRVSRMDWRQPGKIAP